MWSTLPGQSWFGKSIVDIAIVLAAIARHDDLLVALKQVHASNPWADAARALAEHRDDDAASILGAIPSVPLRDAVRAGAASPRR